MYTGHCLISLHVFVILSLIVMQHDTGSQIYSRLAMCGTEQ